MAKSDLTTWHGNRTGGNSNAKVQHTTVAANTNEYNITNLKANATYEVSLVVITNGGQRATVIQQSVARVSNNMCSDFWKNSTSEDVIKVEKWLNIQLTW